MPSLSSTGQTCYETSMKAAVQKINPEEYILAALSPENRLDAALRVAHEAFRGTKLTIADVEAAVRKVRRKQHATRQRKTKSRR
jgi:hypothetical protein